MVPQRPERQTLPASAAVHGPTPLAKPHSSSRASHTPLTQTKRRGRVSAATVEAGARVGWISRNSRSVSEQREAGAHAYRCTTCPRRNRRRRCNHPPAWHKPVATAGARAAHDSAIGSRARAVTRGKTALIVGSIADCALAHQGCRGDSAAAVESRVRVRRIARQRAAVAERGLAHVCALFTPIAAGAIRV